MRISWLRAAITGSAAAALALCQPGLVELRLQTPLSTAQVKAGHYVQAVVTGPLEIDGRIAMPRGTVVHGVVGRVTRVGMGLVRERASLDIQFGSYELPDGRVFPLEGKLHSVDNARESVLGNGRIRGILAANQPYSWVQGMWFQPRPMLFSKSLLGLTGVSGQLLTRFSLGPFGAVGLFAARITAFRLPEPEIYLPVGTDLKVRVDHPASGGPTFDPESERQVAADLSNWVREQPYSITKPNGQSAEDIVNLVFVGSERRLLQAFATAGWSHADALNRKSLAATYRAYTSHSGYPSAPVSKLLLEGAEPEHVFQKSMNTIAKRHHVRLWRREFNGETMWFGAATQDVGITLEPRSMSFTHKIDPLIDRERSKIVNDLEFAQCAGETGYVERAEAALLGGPKRGISTDGRVAIVYLNHCSARMVAEVADPGRPKSVFKRAARRTVLETRHYVLRGNAYYWVYRGLRYRRPKPTLEPPLLLEAKRQQPAGDHNPQLLPGGNPDSPLQNGVVRSLNPPE